MRWWRWRRREIKSIPKAPKTKTLRRSCEDAERSVRRVAKPVVASMDEVELRLAAIHGGVEPPAKFTVADWTQRRLELNWLRGFYSNQQLNSITAGGGAGDYLRLKAYAEEPEWAQLSSGKVVACYPVTFVRADRMRQRMEILGEAAHRVTVLKKQLGQKDADAWQMIRRLDRLRLWQRAALLHEATQQVGTLDGLPIDPPLAGRWAVRVFNWLDGDNRWEREFWRSRWIVAMAWLVFDRLTGANLWLGVPPWWTWVATVEDELAVMRQHLAANDERARALPRLPGTGDADSWGWSGFVHTLAAESDRTTEEFLRERTMGGMQADAVQTYIKNRKQAAEDEKRQKEAGRPK